MINSLLRIAFVALLFAQSPSNAWEIGACSRMELSTVQASSCLAKLLRQEDAVLQRTLEAFRKGIAAQHFTYDTRRNADIRADFVRKLNLAHSSWKALVQIECAELLEGDAFGGTGIATAEFECKIARTRDRVLEIEESEAYKWMLRK